MQKVAQADGKTYLKAWDEYDHHSVVLEDGGVGLVKLGYRVQRAEDIENLREARPAVRRDHRADEPG